MPICTTCSGTGICQSCGGIGSERCSTCNGTGNFPIACPTCGGSGVDNGSVCQNCFGTGKIPDLCPSCNGVGSFQDNQCHGSGRCKDCSGTGQTPIFVKAEISNEVTDQVIQPKFKLEEHRSVFNLVSENRDIAQVVDLLSHMANFALRGFSVSVRDFTYDDSALVQQLVSLEYERLSPLLSPSLLANTTFENDTDAQANQTFARTQGTTATVQWSVTKGFNWGGSVNFRIGTPFIGGGAQFSFNVSFSKTDSQSNTESETWQWSVNIPVPPRSKVVASAMLQQGKYSPSFTAKIRLLGQVKWSFHTPLPNLQDFGSLWDIGVLFTQAPHPDVTVIDNKTVEFIVNGNFEGVQGIETTIKAEQFTLDDDVLINVFNV